MTYNPRIKNLENQIIQLSGSAVTGTVAQFTTLSASFISASSIVGVTIGGGATPAGPDTSIQFNSGSQLSGSGNLTYDYANAVLSGTVARFTAVSASFNGNGTNLTNIPNGALQNSSVTIGSTAVSLGGTATTIAGITSLTASSAFFQGNITVNGTASIAQLNTLNQQSLVVGDKYITILSGAVDHTSLDGSGILWGSGSTGPTVNELGSNAHVRYRNSFDKIEVYPGLYVSGALTASAGISGTLNNLTTNTTVASANLTLNANHHVILGSASVSNITLTLPLVNDSKFRQYIVKKIDPTVNKIIVSGSSNQTIDGQLGAEINTQYEALMIVNDGSSNWYLV